MKKFLSCHAKPVRGVLSGFDRIRFRGTFRQLAHREGMSSILSYLKVPRPPGVTLMRMTLFGVSQEQEQPCEIAFTVRLASDMPACVSATEAQRIIILSRENLLEPYAGGGKYTLRIPDGSKPNLQQ